MLHIVLNAQKMVHYFSAFLVESTTKEADIKDKIFLIKRCVPFLNKHLSVNNLTKSLPNNKK